MSLSVDVCLWFDALQNEVLLVWTHVLLQRNPTLLGLLCKFWHSKTRFLLIWIKKWLLMLNIDFGSNYCLFYELFITWKLLLVADFAILLISSSYYSLSIFFCCFVMWVLRRIGSRKRWSTELWDCILYRISSKSTTFSIFFSTSRSKCPYLAKFPNCSKNYCLFEVSLPSVRSFILLMALLTLKRNLFIFNPVSRVKKWKLWD